ncbi:unnamed protein product [Phaeothamnion confervicola]
MVRSLGMPINRFTLQRFAVMAKNDLLASDKLGDEEDKRFVDFSGGLSWAKWFVQRYALSSTVLHGLGGGVDKAAIKAGIAAICAALVDHDFENIYNVDETGLFRILPTVTYLSQHDDRKSARGAKGMKVKDRITLFVCTYATGRQEVPLSIIGTAKNTRCFKGRLPSVSIAIHNLFNFLFHDFKPCSITLPFRLHSRCAKSTKPRRG